MKTWQKIVKLIAVVFAVFLSVIIISSICTAVLSLSFLSVGNKSASKDMTVYAVDEDIKTLEIEVGSGELVIKNDDEFRVESNNNFLSVKQRGSSLVIEEQRRLFSNNKDIVIELYIPEGTVFKKADIDTGAGKVEIETLQADKLELSLGAGEVKIESLTATEKADIESGAGEVSIKNAILTDLDFEMGVGAVDITAELFGRCDIDQGVGNLKLDLIGTEDDYRIEVDEGMGEIKLNGETVKDNTFYGNGENKIDITGGVGSMKIKYVNKEE